MKPRQGKLKGMSRQYKKQLHKNRAERQEKKRKQQEYRKQKYSERTEKKLEQNKVNITYGHKKRKTKVDYRQDKINWLIDQGYDNPLAEFTLKEIDSLHISDIRKGTLKSENVPFLNKNKVNFNRVKRLLDENGNQYYTKIAYRSLSWNNTLNDIIPRYTNLSNDKLVELAKNLMTMEATYMADKHGNVLVPSSGKDGEVIYQTGSINDFRFHDFEVNHIQAQMNKAWSRQSLGSKKPRIHTGDKHHLQYIRLHGSTAIDSMSFRECLLIYCAVAENVTEQNRIDFTNHYYRWVMMTTFAEECHKLGLDILNVF